MFFGIYVLENPHDQKIRKIYCQTKIAFYTLKLTFFKKFDGKFEIYGLKTPITKKLEKSIIRLMHYALQYYWIYVFCSFSKEIAVLKINSFLKIEQVPEKWFNRPETSHRCSLVGFLPKLLRNSFFSTWVETPILKKKLSRFWRFFAKNEV